MKTIKKLFLSLALVFAFCGISHAQTALTQTTLSAAVNGPSAYSGTTASYQTFVTLASITGLLAPVLPGTPVSVIYIGREAMGVLTVPTSASLPVGVIRGYLGTQAAPHPSGDMVLVAPAYQTNLQFGGNPQPNGFFSQDPPQNGTCTAAGTPATPWVNILTGAQWLCSSVTGTWIPGFNNAYPDEPSAAVASAAGQITPSGPLFHVTGAAAITGFLIPVGFNATAVGGGSFCVVPDGAFTTTTANNIAIASTAVVNRLICWQWDAKNSKFVPTY